VNKYDVHAYVIVRVKYVDIVADSQADAITQVREEGLNLNTRLSSDYQGNLHIPNPLGHTIEYHEYDDSERPVYWLVDEQGDEDYVRSRWYDSDENSKEIT
jgi:hypothetical protein